MSANDIGFFSVKESLSNYQLVLNILCATYFCGVGYCV